MPDRPHARSTATALPWAFISPRRPYSDLHLPHPTSPPPAMAITAPTPDILGERQPGQDVRTQNGNRSHTSLAARFRGLFDPSDGVRVVLRGSEFPPGPGHLRRLNTLGAMDCSKNEGAVAALPDDPLVEILSRVPAKSVCRFKCVSKAWRDLIADPHQRKKLPQAMQGLFVMMPVDFFNVSFSFVDLMTARSVPLDIDPAFSFLKERPGFQFHNLGLMDSCNGLILFKNHQVPPYSDAVGYVVCNPTTKRWQAVPTCGSLHLTTFAYLAFDQAISSHFHLVQLQLSMQDEVVVSLHAYSSETRIWSHNQMDSQENKRLLAEWHYDAIISRRYPECAFVNGFLHFIVGESDQHQIVAVDVQGKTRRVITVPGVAHGGQWYSYLGQSQGCLHYMAQEMCGDHEEKYKLFIWVLKDYGTQEWVLKDTMSSLEMFGHVISNILHFIVGIHQDRNVLFFSQPCSDNLIAYDMDHKEVSVITTFEFLKKPLRIVHYVPCFSESPALTN